MNVDDVKEVKVLTGLDALKAIFQRQAHLKEKYHHIEEKNGIGYGIVAGIPFNPDNPRWQYFMKDMAWRSIEEVAEADDAYRINLMESSEVLFTQHVKEEIADSLHFLVELLLIVDIRPEHLKEIWFNVFNGDIIERTSHTLSQAISFYVRELGMAMNCLKQKPWKQSHFLTDIPAFHSRLKRAFGAWCLMALTFGMSEREVFLLYFKKSEVNKFRQRSNY